MEHFQIKLMEENKSGFLSIFFKLLANLRGAKIIITNFYKESPESFSAFNPKLELVVIWRYSVTAIDNSIFLGKINQLHRMSECSFLNKSLHYTHNLLIHKFKEQ